MSLQTPTLGIVVVVYKSAADTVDFVKRQLPKVACPYRAVIVDLGSDLEFTRDLAGACGADVYAGTVDAARTVFFAHCQENLGYARGNNLGARLLLQHFSGLTGLLFSNNDIELPTPDAVSLLLARLQSLPDVACIGPRVVGLDGHDQSPLYEPISLREITCMELFSPPLCRLFLPGARRPGPRDPAQEGYCYAVSGCFLMVRATDFVAAGMFDPATFLYREEEILSERLLRRNRKVYYLASTVVRHHGGKTIGKYIAGSRVNRLHFESSRYYYKTYRGATALQLGLFQLAKHVSLSRARLLNLFRQSPVGASRNVPPTPRSDDACPPQA